MVGRLEWLENEDSWSLTDVNGQDLGMFNGVVASDKSTFSQRFTQVTGKPPPLGISITNNFYLYLFLFIYFDWFLQSLSQKL